MELRPAQALGELGKAYRMPVGIARGSDETKKAWTIGVFMGAVGEDAFETKEITVRDREKTYEKLEIHDLSPQMYVVLSGSVAIPVAQDLDGDAVMFYEVGEGEGVVLGPKVWHGGPVGTAIPATVLVVLRKGTTELDTTKSEILPIVRFGPCSCQLGEDQ